MGRGGKDELQNCAREESCHSATLDEIVTSRMRCSTVPSNQKSVNLMSVATTVLRLLDGVVGTLLCG